MLKGEQEGFDTPARQRRLVDTDGTLWIRVVVFLVIATTIGAGALVCWLLSGSLLAVAVVVNILEVSYGLGTAYMHIRFSRREGVDVPQRMVTRPTSKQISNEAPSAASNKAHNDI